MKTNRKHMRTSTKIKYLKIARDLISDKKRWCQNCPSQDKNGDECWPTKHRAVKWCAIGAMVKARKSQKGWNTLRKEINKDLPEGYNLISDLNDDLSTGHAHRRVIGVFNRTIKRLEKELS